MAETKRKGNSVAKPVTTKKEKKSGVEKDLGDTRKAGKSQLDEKKRVGGIKRPPKTSEKSENRKERTDNRQKTDERKERRDHDAGFEADWARGVIDQLVEAQRSWLEITTKQYELVFSTVSDVYEKAEFAPSEAMANWAKQGVQAMVEAQKQWSGIAIKQGEDLLGAIQAGHLSKDDVLESVQSSAAMGLETLVGLRMAWLDFAAKQNAQMVKMVKDGLNLEDSSPAAALADFAQAAMDSYVEIQKRWLGMAVEVAPFGKKGE